MGRITPYIMENNKIFEITPTRHIKLYNLYIYIYNGMFAKHVDMAAKHVNFKRKKGVFAAFHQFHQFHGVIWIVCIASHVNGTSLVCMFALYLDSIG